MADAAAELADEAMLFSPPTCNGLRLSVILIVELAKIL